MRNKEFVFILKDLYEKEQALRNDINNEIEVSNHSTKSFVLKENGKTFDIVVTLLLILNYKNIINELKDLTLDAVTNSLKYSQLENKEYLFKIWNENKDFICIPYFEKFLNLLTSYNISTYRDLENDITLAKWINDVYLLKNRSVYWCHIEDETTLNVILNCEKQIDINLHKGKFLVCVFERNIFEYFLLQRSHSCDITFCCFNDNDRTIIEINNMLLNASSKHHIVEAQHLDSFSLSHELYDGVIIQNDDLTFSKNEMLNLNNLLKAVKNGGIIIDLGYAKETDIKELFFDYEIPIMFNYVSGAFSLVLRKSQDKSQKVRYCSFFVDSSNIINDSSYWEEKLTDCVKNSLTTEFFQILTKDDFRYSRSFKFKDVARLLDQLNFVWKKKSEVYSICDDQEEWLYNASIDEERIISSKNLSVDPFKTHVKECYYLNGFLNKEDKGSHILNECEYKRGRDNYSFNISEKIDGIFHDLYINDNTKTEEEKRMDKRICCRIVTTPCLLFSKGSGILCINASKKSPVCFRKYFFLYTNNGFRDSLDCFPDCDIIKINPDYDQNFIIYQLLKETNSFYGTHILVAPSKEEQHTYFLNKRLDYISEFQPVINEMESEVIRSIAESPACLTGVGFTNFRRFTNLPIIPFGGVNILVGGNNAGKSTLVKGMLLVFDNLKNFLINTVEYSSNAPKFQFDAKDRHDIHVGTFNRAYSYLASKDNEELNQRCMSFTISCSHFEITLGLKPIDGGDTPAVPISLIKVKDKKRKALFVFDYDNFITSVKFSIDSEAIDFSYHGLKAKEIKAVENLIPTLIRNIISPTNENSLFLDNQALIEKIKGKSGFIIEIADELERVIRNVNVEYIYAHGVIQKVLYNYKDKNDYMAQTLHDLLSERIGDVERNFICHWIDVFGLGNDFDVSTLGGEAYIIQIKKENGRMVYLADMGMGSNQLVVLLLRLAIIIHKQRMYGMTPYRPTIIVEEPEQNMHPEYQSKLASLFYEVNHKYGFNFIIETHSEYLVRKSQVIVAQQKFKDQKELRDNNPFKVYYFPSEGNPYEMIYRTDGNFSNEFGKGFYDEANNLLFEII